MAQTIAMQRGTSTTSGTGFISTTLFTQSGGLATRVIFNGLAHRSAQSQYWVSINVVSSGGSSSIIGWGQYYAQGSQFVPMAMQANTAYSAGGATGPSANLPTAWANQSNTTYPGASQPNQIANGYPGLALGGGMPLNFWIGPNDSVVHRIYNTGATTDFGWSFTTITES